MKYLSLIILLLSGCATQKKCNEKFPVTASKDSIYIETVKEVPYYLPGDSVIIEVPVYDCADQDLILTENGKLKQIISILNGKLTSNTQIKPDTVIIPIKEISTVVKEVKVPTPVKYTPKWIKIFACIGGVLAGLGLVIGVLKLKKLVGF